MATSNANRTLVHMLTGLDRPLGGCRSTAM